MQNGICVDADCSRSRWIGLGGGRVPLPHLWEIVAATRPASPRSEDYGAAETLVSDRHDGRRIVARWSVPAHPEPVEGQAPGDRRRHQNGKPVTTESLLGVGAAFDIYAGLLPQAPPWMQRSELEWLYRLGREPRRLWRRYLRNNPRFVVEILRRPPVIRATGELS